MNKSHLKVYEEYLNRRKLYAPFIKDDPDKNLGLIVIIPCFNEPDIIMSLNSLCKCTRPLSNVEIIVLINSSEVSLNEIVEWNRKTFEMVLKWLAQNNNDWLTCHAILLEGIPRKDAGVGYARKIAMDEAINRFLLAGTEKGIICSFDADSTVLNNYFLEIENLFLAKPNCNGCSIYFEHPIDGDGYPQSIYDRIIEYELHLRYYKLMLNHIGFPYYHYTIGSGFAVAAHAYCLQGGMNKKQAGEDFYFLQKIMPMGNYYDLNSTTVFPSPRPSDRVPFGTGAMIAEYGKEPEKEYLTYNFEAFTSLKQLFADITLIYDSNETNMKKIMEKYSVALKDFLETNNFIKAVLLIRENTASLKNFEKRFYHWFDAFKIIKYLNFSHTGYYRKQSVDEAVNKLYSKNKLYDIELFSKKNLLLLLRNIEKNIQTI